jgi:hypothetical protein
MKKLIILLICLIFFLPGSSAAWNPMVVGTGGGGESAPPTADPDCLAAYLFADDLTDESGEGHTLTDGSGDGVNYQAVYPSPNNVAMTTGKSILFDGTNDCVNIASSSIGDIGFPGENTTGVVEDFSVAFWAKKTNDSGAEESMMAHAFDWHVYFTGPGDVLKMHVREESGADEDYYTAAHDTSGDTDWYHYVVVWEGGVGWTVWVSSDGAGSSFGDTLNGVTDAAADVADVYENESNGSPGFNIGCYKNDETGPFDGYIYQPILFKRVINATEAEEIYTNGIDGGG